MPNADTQLPQNPSRPSYGALAIAAVAGVALLGGVGIGTILSTNPEATDQQIETYIRNNPELI
ncbi:MAG: hypothetical protein EBU10_06520, partial [Alphaproteobacteria bacterium]|nr:hypothetical protein [Alphaproteobacteria bacterium]